MAYPGELENVEYMNYKIEQESNGQPALSKDEWRMQRQPPPQMPQMPQAPQTPQQPDPRAVQSVTQALLNR